MRSRKSAPFRDVRVAEPGVITQLAPRGRSGAMIDVVMDHGTSYAMHAEIVLEHRLEIGQTLDLATLQRAIDADDLIAAKQSATRLLAYRPRSISELRRELAERGFGQGTIDDVIQRFTELGYLDDQDFARRWIATREAVAPRGERLLRQELRQKGIRADFAEQALEDADLDDVASATRIAEHRLSKMTGIDRDVQRRRIAGYLERRGFGWDTIRSVDRVCFSNASTEPDEK